MKRSKYLSALILLVFMGTSAIIAQPMKGAQKAKKAKFVELNLSDQQEKQFEQIRFANEEKMIQLRSDIAKNKLEIKKLIASDNFNKSDLLNLTRKETELESQAKLARTEMWADVYEILNADQKKVWLDQLENRFERRPPMEMRERMKRNPRMMEKPDDLEN